VLPPRGQALLALAGTPALTRADVVELTGELTRCGARDLVERQVRRNVEVARALVDGACLPPRVAAALRSLAMDATDRQQ
jgi:hypothetical protein